MIRSGSEILVGSTNSVVGRLGAIVENRDGSFLALTSREILEHGNQISLGSNTGEDVLIGEKTQRFSRSIGMTAGAFSLLGWFAVAPQVAIASDTADTFSGVLPTSDLFKCLGETVYAKTLEGARSIGVVTSIASDVFYEIDGEKHLFQGLFKIEPENDSNASLTEGCSGLAVQTSEGQLIGLIVGQTERSILVAPVAEPLAWEGFELPDSDRIKCYNKLLDRRYSSGPAEEFMSRVSSEPNKWVKICRSTRRSLSDYFTEQNRLFGRGRMIDIQDELAQFLYYVIGPKDITENVHHLLFHHDAPGRNANENWLWRALFERLQLMQLGPEIDKVCTTHDPAICFKLNVDSTEMIQDSFTDPFEREIADNDLDALADALLGPDAANVEAVL